MTLLICRTCPRYDRRANGRFARTFQDVLATSLGSDGASTAIRGVQCLGGCPNDGVVALDDPEKARVRFTALEGADAPAVLAAAAAYDLSDTGAPGDWTVPAELRAHLSSTTRKFVKTHRYGADPWPGRTHGARPGSVRLNDHRHWSIDE